MEFVWWTLIILLFIFSYIGIVFPIIPGVSLIWGGLLIYHFAIAPLVGWQFWLTMIILTIITLVVDYLSSSTWVKRWGGSRAGAWAAIAGILIGPFIFGPLGVFVGPFIFVIVVEMLRGVKVDKAIKIGFASFLGLLGGGLLKALFHSIMIIIFFIKI